MKIALLFDQPHWTGLGEYALQLYGLLLPNVEDVKLIYAGAKEDDFLIYYSRPYLKRTKIWANRPFVIKRNYRKVLQDNELKDYIFHFLGYELYTLKEHRAVLTVHDVIKENAKDKISLLKGLKLKEILVSMDRNRQIKQTIKLCSYASAIVSISDKTRRELENASGMNSVKIYHWIVNNRFHKRDKAEALLTLKLDQEFKYFLAVGNDRPNKRIDLIKLFASFLPDDCKLIKIGAPIESKNVINVGTVSESCYPLYFNISEGYIHLSEDEGFGRPIIEAIASEIPIICRSNNINTELLGDSAIYLNEFFTLDNIMDIIRKITTQETLNELHSKMRERKFLFSQEEALDKYLEVYTNCYHNRK